MWFIGGGGLTGPRGLGVLGKQWELCAVAVAELGGP